MVRHLQHHVCLLVLTAALFACGSDSSIADATPCRTDRDCVDGVCQGGLCRAVDQVGGGGGGGDDVAGDGADVGGDDVGSPDATDVGGPDAVDQAPEQGHDAAALNGCGGTAALDGEPGDSCGECDDGEWACDGPNTVSCEGASSTNLCGGCGPLPGLPGAPCDECNGGLFVCEGGDLICDCYAVEPDGTCDAPFPIALGDVRQLSLCEARDDEDPIAGAIDCRDVNVRGEDVVYSLRLAERTAVVIDLRDDDEERAVDTIVYVRDTCADDQSQLLCSDDVPCGQSNVDIGPCSGEVQVRQSTMRLELDAGTHFIIADSFDYATGAGSFGCGAVRLEVAEAVE